MKDQESNPRPHTPRPAALPIKVQQWVTVPAHPVARPQPRAKKASERSSMQGTMRAVGCMAAAMVRTEDRDPAYRAGSVCWEACHTSVRIWDWQTAMWEGRRIDMIFELVVS